MPLTIEDLDDDDEEVRVTNPKTGGQKGRKLAQLGAVDPLALLELAKVAGIGAKKYAPYNYLKGFEYSSLYNAAARHLLKFWAGQDLDLPTQRYHAAMAGWHCLALTSYLLRGIGIDDRPPRLPSKKGKDRR